MLGSGLIILAVLVPKPSSVKVISASFWREVAPSGMVRLSDESVMAVGGSSSLETVSKGSRECWVGGGG